MYIHVFRNMGQQDYKNMLQSNQWGNEEFKTTNGIEFVVPTEVTETFLSKNERNIKNP